MRTFVAAAGWLRDRAVASYLAAQTFLKEKEEGATLVEYALLVALIAMVCLAGVAVLGTYLSSLFTSLKTNLVNNGA